MILLSDVWWSDPGWWLAIFFGVVGSGIISVLIYRRQRNRKQITYQVISDAPIVSIDKRVEEKVKIIYEDKGNRNEINDANLVSLKVLNSGESDVKIWNSKDDDVEDMERPITFKFEGRTIISLTEIKTDPAEDIIESKYLERYLKEPSPTPDILGLPRCLLKRHQSINLSVLVKGTKGKITQQGKLFQGEITEYAPNNSLFSSRNVTFATILFSIIMIIVAVIITINLQNQLNLQHDQLKQSVACNTRTFYQTGIGQSTYYQLLVPNGCVGIIWSNTAKVNGRQWNNGGVMAFSSGSYSVNITDGSIEVLPANAANTEFCNVRTRLTQSGSPISVSYPLAGWHSC